MLFTRAHLPTSIRTVVREASTQKVLAWTPVQRSTLPEEFLVATSDALIFAKLHDPDSETPTPARSWPWAHIDRAAWDPTTSLLTVTFTTAAEALTAPMPTKIPVRFLTTIRERIEHSVVMSETVPLKDGRKARVALRRPVNGELFIEVLHDTPHPTPGEKDRTKIDDVVARFHDLSGAPLKTC
ncbi:hypothetical protein [Jonesia quinghaiensis]|uniref:hypothetical protein n=1 Tax=Jonesia quinghaiensis TaxID=262806 RepID=UPI000405C500|nr:hypothetical protein [Jonesia quinghaiensis]